MLALAQKREELAAKQKSLHSIIEEAGPDLDMTKIKSIPGDTAAKAAEIKRLNFELAQLGIEVDNLVSVEKAVNDFKAQEAKSNQPVSPIAFPSQPQIEVPKLKAIGDLAVTVPFRGRLVVDDFDQKVLMTTAAGWAADSIRRPGYVPLPAAQPKVIDLLPFYSTSQAGFTYMAESTNTNNTAGRAEGANNAGESAFALTATPIVMVEHAGNLPVTQEQMDDVSYARPYINTALTEQLRRTLNAAIMTGGGAPSFTGIIGMAGINTQAKGALPTLDALYMGATAVEVTGCANPGAYVMHPNDYRDVILTRTADGLYILGNPTDPGVGRIWGLPVVKDTACTEGTAVVGDWATYSQYVQYQGITLEYTDSHGTEFIQRIRRILASVRSQFIVTRASAFTQITGI